MVVTVQTRGIETVHPVREYAEEKFRTLEKFFDGITKAEIIVGMISHHHKKGEVYFAEVTLDLPKKYSIHVEKEAEDLYKAIDKVKDHCKVELDQMKDKIREKDALEIREQKVYQMDDEA